MACSPTTVSPTGKRLVKTKSGLRMVSLIDQEKSAFEIDEPVWQNDDEHLLCNKCGSKFSFTIRRHHCRRCGKIFCGSCCFTKTVLPRLGFVDPQRICSDCVSIAKRELDLYNKYLPILLQGAEFELDETTDDFVNCKLNARQRELVFADPKEVNNIKHEPVFLQSITSFQCLTDPFKQTQEGGALLVGVNMKYLSNGTNKQIQLKIKTTVN